MNIVEKYNDALQKIYDHVGFREDWAVFKIDDRSEMYWQVTDNRVRFAQTMDKLNSSGDYYEDEIYYQRFYQKHIYRGAEFTLIFVDTHTDGNKFFAIYRNSKEVEKK